MSPTIFRTGSYRFYFFSREEARMHVHIQSPDGEAKFWLEPVVELAQNYGLTDRQLRAIQIIVEERENDLRKAWERHFGS